MLILKPISVETIWGSDRLRPFGADPDSESVGQLYTVAAQENMSNLILNPEYIGKTLREVFEDQWEKFGYLKSHTFPLLIGFVDANDDLSIQVHPTDSFAKAYEGKEYGKNESWFFLNAPKSTTIYNGILCDSVKELQTHVEQGTVMDIIDTLSIHTGDYVYVESGTVHALRSGSLVYEIQQSTDLTYRVYDYDRTDSHGNHRPLHLEKAYSVIDFSKKSCAVPMKKDQEYREAYYSVEKRCVEKTYTNDSDVFSCVTIIHGEMICEGLKACQGMSIIVFPHESVSFTGTADCIIAKPY